jgi:hypothetical protein
MNARHRQLAAVVTLVALAGAGLAGCSSSESTPAPNTSSSMSLVAPIIVDLKTANGTSVSVSMSNIVDLLTGDSAVTDWQGLVADSTVATFIDGKVDGGATFNPGVRPKSDGSTKVTVTNSTTGAVVTFDLTVTK